MTRWPGISFALIAFLSLSAIRVEPTFGFAGEKVKSLKELARDSPTGEVVFAVPPDSEGTYIDLHELAAFSDAVIVGTPISNRSSLSPDESSVVTDYVFRVDEVVLGPFRPGDELTVQMPWGRVEFPDGTAAQFDAGWFRAPLEGHSYALLLQRRVGRSVMSPTGGPQGVFELGDNGTITVSSGRRDDPVWTYIDMPTEPFLQLLRRAVDDSREPR